MMKYLLVLVFLYFVCINAKDGKEKKEKKEKEGGKPSGKKIAIRQSGDIDITISRRKWSSEKQSRTLCCPLAGKHCKYPCKGLSCSTKCTLSCGLFSLFSCAPVTCGTANPFQCVPSTTCPSGWTVSASKCFQYFPGPANWLAALQLCIAQGGTLAKVESQAEHDLVQGLVGTADPAWTGLQDFLDEGIFTWADGTALGSYGTPTGTIPPWQNNQPSNSGVGQDCVVIGSNGWNDIRCNVERGYVCQRAAST